jgi:cytochrome c peroxidase
VKRLGLLLLLAACPKHNERTPAEPRVKHDAAAAPVVVADAAGSAAEVTLPPSPPVPAVPYGLPQPPERAAITPDAVAYGALLFADPALSKSGKTACATCHDPQHGYSGRVDTTDAGDKEALRTPALVNLAWARSFGWDGKIAALPEFLEAHATRELGLDVPPATPLYLAYNARLGGERPWIPALAAFVLTRYAGDSTWDRLERAPSRPAQLEAGYKVFTGKGECYHCHAPPLYTDLRVDDGYRTPTVRGAARRPALLHDGSAATLEALLDKHGSPRLSPADKAALAAFLRAL